jgi:hypothetical protein
MTDYYNISGQDYTDSYAYGQVQQQPQQLLILWLSSLLLQHAIIIDAFTDVHFL